MLHPDFIYIKHEIVRDIPYRIVDPSFVQTAPQVSSSTWMRLSTDDCPCYHVLRPMSMSVKLPAKAIVLSLLSIPHQLRL